MIDKKNIQFCSGCGACKNVCKKEAIQMVEDKEGFLYPQIDMQKCVNCTMCETVCQIDKRYENDSKKEKEYYALVNKDNAHLSVSSSGGAFLSVAKYVFQKQGVVVGCAFDDNLVAHHIVTYNLKECIENLCGSKYVQSDTKTVYVEIKKLLSTGRLVLFTGTPCQVEGLYLYLRKKPDNLITIDLICHGVSSPLLWKKHKEYLENCVHSKIDKFRFRGKEKTGWALYYYYYYGKNKCKKGPSILDRYYADFLKGNNYRESCYTCRYANLNRVGDLTIGDFWGAEKYFPRLNVRKGVSLLLVNTKKGNETLCDIKDLVVLRKTTMQNATAENHNLIEPTKRPSVRNVYYNIAFEDFMKWEKEYTNTQAWKIAKLKSIIPSFIKKLIRK